MSTSSFVRVDGPTEEIRAISRRMKDAPKEFRRELPKALAGGAKIIRTAGKEEAQRMDLPRGGGFEAKYRRAMVAGVTTKIRKLSTKPSVEVGYGGRSKATSLAKGVAKLMNNRGYIRHPEFGDRSRWSNTETGNEGWFKDVTESHTDEAIEEMTKRMEGLASRLAMIHDAAAAFRNMG